MDSNVDPVVNTPEPTVAPVEAPVKPEVDVNNIRKQAAYFAKHPEAAEVFLENYDQLSGGKLEGRVKSLEMAFITEQALRKFNLTDDDRDLIEAPTPEGVFAKAEKLSKRRVASEEAGKPQEAPQIEYPEPKYEPKNPLEAANARLMQFR